MIKLWKCCKNKFQKKRNLAKIYNPHKLYNFHNNNYYFKIYPNNNNNNINNFMFHLKNFIINQD
jgi:hypothetical protein